MNATELAATVALRRRLWPHAPHVTADAMQAWELLLADIDPHVAGAAILALAEEGREWPPPPGLIRRRAFDLATPIPEADRAWNEVCAQIRAVGSLRGTLDYATGTAIQPTWSHQLVGQVADHLGWQTLCESTNPVADRAHFLRLWEQATARQRTVEHLPPAARQALEHAGIALLDMSARRALSEAS